MSALDDGLPHLLIIALKPRIWISSGDVCWFWIVVFCRFISWGVSVLFLGCDLRLFRRQTVRLECVRRCVGMIRRGAAWSPGLPGVVAETTPKCVVFKRKTIEQNCDRGF